MNQNHFKGIEAPIDISQQKSKLKVNRRGIKIREMEIDDLAPVYHLGERLFESDKLPTMYRTWDAYEVTGFFHADSEYCQVAEYKNEIIGFALGTTITKSRSAWKYGYLIWLGVHPDFQKYGVGKKLFMKFKDLMVDEKVRILMVDTAVDDLAAVRFFKRMGFSQPQQQIYMTLNLSTQRKAKATKKKKTAKSIKS